MASGSQGRRIFTGEHVYSVDSQRRIALPRSWRGEEESANQFLLIPSDDPCIHMVPMALCGRVLDRMEEAIFVMPDGLRLFGSAGARAANGQCDRQGRLALPSHLLEHARITDRVVMVGNFVTIAVWSPAVWEEARRPASEGSRALRSAFVRPEALMEVFRSQAERQPDG
ncbi:MAG: hypothetical protein JXR77_00105 [Lentisphaeria bacterium]|nr:hypothetical protein [Lentisphaeria bacterium]